MSKHITTFFTALTILFLFSSCKNESNITNMAADDVSLTTSAIQVFDCDDPENGFDIDYLTLILQQAADCEINPEDNFTPNVLENSTLNDRINSLMNFGTSSIYSQHLKTSAPIFSRNYTRDPYMDCGYYFDPVYQYIDKSKIQYEINLNLNDYRDDDNFGYHFSYKVIICAPIINNVPELEDATYRVVFSDVSTENPEYYSFVGEANSTVELRVFSNMTDCVNNLTPICGYIYSADTNEWNYINGNELPDASMEFPPEWIENQEPVESEYLDFSTDTEIEDYQSDSDDRYDWDGTEGEIITDPAILEKLHEAVQSYYNNATPLEKYEYEEMMDALDYQLMHGGDAYGKDINAATIIPVQAIIQYNIYSGDVIFLCQEKYDFGDGTDLIIQYYTSMMRDDQLPYMESGTFFYRDLRVNTQMTVMRYYNPNMADYYPEIDDSYPCKNPYQFFEWDYPDLYHHLNYPYEFSIFNSLIPDGAIEDFYAQHGINITEE